MTPAEFLSEGWLQEVNRRLLHPAGLALMMTDDNGTVRFHSVMTTDDPAGFTFKIDNDARSKAANIDLVLAKRERQRELKHGYIVQPVD